MRIAVAALFVVAFGGSALADTPPDAPPAAPPVAPPPATPGTPPAGAPAASPPAQPRAPIGAFPPPCAVPDATWLPARKAWIPAWSEQVTYEKTSPACFETRCIPLWTTAQEPIMQKVCGPKTVHVEVPVYGVTTVPVFETKKVPVCGEVTVPVYASRRRPVMGWGVGCGCKETDVPWFWVTEQVQCGVKRETRFLGYKIEKVQVGTTTQKCQIGTRIEERICGIEEKEVLVGMRDVKKVCGQETQDVMVRPATTRTVTETLVHPGRWVTVSDTQNPVPILGTDTVLTEAQYRAELSAVAARPIVTPPANARR
jgi:hypothetical protein